ncbi:hypothetical protein [Nonomuraea sp. NPDC049504]|uniref:hypothetical protein n=1 Tax=Nonomuraea sp. NPDC049504 TaxID=3154729 RepID=UPI00342661A1
MTIRKWVLAGTAVVVAAMAVMFAILGWDQADKIGSVASALAGVAAVGVALWAAWPIASSSGSIHVSKTGRATAQSGGRANTGFSGRVDAVPGQVRVQRTGDAEADGGDANSGVDLT